MMRSHVPVLAGPAVVALLVLFAILLFSALPSVSHSQEPAVQETLWFGGLDPETGLAVEGGIWDFDDCTLQGWTSVDLTDHPVFFTHVTADSHAALGDPVCCVISPGGSTGSMWCGAHQDYADDRCWPGGMGYSNSWGQYMAKTFTYGGQGYVTLSFDYFVDSETEFDFTYVYVRDAEGNLSDPLNTSNHPNGHGYGYSGAVHEGTNIGSPASPAHDEIRLAPGNLPRATNEEFEIVFNVTSDELYSDGLDDWGGFLNSVWGPFGVDNVHVHGVNLDDLSDFEPTGIPGEQLDGWVHWAKAPIGSFMKVAHLDDLEPVGDPDCPLTECVLVASDTSQFAEYPHPESQNAYLVSNPIPLDGLDLAAVIFDFQIWADLHRDYGVGLRIVMNYYPWTCPSTGDVGWTLEPAGDGGFFFEETPGCYSILGDNGQYLPLGENSPDSLKMAFEILAMCDDFPWGCEYGPAYSNQSPYFDQIRVGLVPSPPTGVDEEPDASVPPAALLGLSAPNPIRGTASISYTLGREGAVTLTIYDVAGSVTRRLMARQPQRAGDHEIGWDGRGDRGRQVAAGVYFVRLESGTSSLTRKLVVSR